MQHIDFVLWMILFPVSVSFCGYVDSLKYKPNEARKVYSKETEFYTAFFVISIWLIVGIKLF